MSKWRPFINGPIGDAGTRTLAPRRPIPEAFLRSQKKRFGPGLGLMDNTDPRSSLSEYYIAESSVGAKGSPFHSRRNNNVSHSEQLTRRYGLLLQMPSVLRQASVNHSEWTGCVTTALVDTVLCVCLWVYVCKDVTPTNVKWLTTVSTLVLLNFSIVPFVFFPFEAGIANAISSFK